MKNYILPAFMLLWLFIVGVVILKAKGPDNIPTSSVSTGTTVTPRIITLTEVAKHSSPSDCYMAIAGKVYDVTSYISQHPGGNIIINGCGIDATELFNSVRQHSRGSTQNILSQFQIGVLSP